MRRTSKILTVLMGAAAMQSPTPSSAATYPARVISRANCLVPLPKLSLVQSGGYTFNESISWDPFFWNPHRAQVQSLHYRSVFAYGFWSDYLIRNFVSGNSNQASWRVWAGSADKGDRRELPRGYLPHRSVKGNHWERYDNANWVDYKWTGAVDCNVTTW